MERELLIGVAVALGALFDAQLARFKHVLKFRGFTVGLLKGERAVSVVHNLHAVGKARIIVHNAIIVALDLIRRVRKGLSRILLGKRNGIELDGAVFIVLLNGTGLLTRGVVNQREGKRAVLVQVAALELLPCTQHD